MSKLIFVNLPVADLDRSIAFYKAVGADQNMQFSDSTAACMVVSETICRIVSDTPASSPWVMTLVILTTMDSRIFSRWTCYPKITGDKNFY